MVQSYAKDRRGKTLSALNARRSSTYYCCGCGGEVRVRGGQEIRLHFYHLRLSDSCPTRGKSLLHLEIQRLIQRQIGEGQCQMERRFPAIGRIADLLWDQLVIEIQVSPISLAEVQEREADYLKEDCRILWVLHEKNFNRAHPSDAEAWLRRRGNYLYSNHTVQGKGMLYLLGVLGNKRAIALDEWRLPPLEEELPLGRRWREQLSALVSSVRRGHRAVVYHLLESFAD